MESRHLLRKAGSSIAIASQAAKLLVINELCDRGILAADGTSRILLQLELAELHIEGVEVEQSPRQRLADAENELERLDGLHRPDNTRQDAQYARLLAARRHPGRRRLGAAAAAAVLMKGLYFIAETFSLRETVKSITAANSSVPVLSSGFATSTLIGKPA